jgi:hypothetical protein
MTNQELHGSEFIVPIKGKAGTVRYQSRAKHIIQTCRPTLIGLELRSLRASPSILYGPKTPWSLDRGTHLFILIRVSPRKGSPRRDSNLTCHNRGCNCSRVNTCYCHPLPGRLNSALLGTMGVDMQGRRTAQMPKDTEHILPTISSRGLLRQSQGNEFAITFTRLRGVPGWTQKHEGMRIP